MRFDWLSDLRDVFFRSSPRVRRTAAVYRSPVAEVCILESRVMLSATMAASEDGSAAYVMDVLPAVDPALIAQAGAANAAATSANGPFPDSETFLLHSRPSATKVIYLDFTGHTTTGTPWNSTSLPTIDTPAYDFEGGIGTFTTNELGRMQQIWQRVAEAFSPFDVDVTTAEPPIEDLVNSGSGDTRWGIRVIIGGNGNFPNPQGGVAYIGSFGDSIDIGCFVFEDNLGNGDEKFTADATVHEIGHTLGLIHDGRTTPAEEYYGGHGAGPTGWAPHMGVGYSQQLVQFSKGEYPNANNFEDDLTIITTQNGFGYRPDDYGNSAAAATTLVFSGTTGTASGVIETRTDTDWLKFTVGGTVSLQIDPAVRGAMLDIEASLYDASFNLIATSNLADSLSATLATTTDGTFYLKIDGVGKAANGTDFGYSDYGSIGQFTVSATIVNADLDDAIDEAILIPTSNTITGTLTPRTDVDMYRFSVLAGQTVTFDIDRPTGSTLDSHLRLFNGSGIQLATNDDGPTPGETTTTESYISYSFSSAGQYYIGVSGAGNRTYDPVVGSGDLSGSTGGYILNLVKSGGNTPPVVNDQSFSVVENVALGTLVGTVAASDANAGQVLTFAITAGNTGNAFAISSTSGRITVNGPIDFETINKYLLTVQVTDNGSPVASDTAVITISVLDVAEADTDDQISEAVLISTTGTAAGLINPGTDVDMFRFSVVAGQQVGFDIDRPTGSVLDSYLRLFNSSGTQLALNNNGTAPGEIASNDSYISYTFATAGVYYLGVSGAGNASYSATAGTGDLTGSTGGYNLILTTPGGNKAPVVNDQTFSIAENSAVGTLVGAVIASDPDSGQTLTYSITAGNSANAFAINATTGRITVNGPIDYETTNKYLLTVQVRDSGSPALTDNAVITINVADVAEGDLDDQISEAITLSPTSGVYNGQINLGTDVDMFKFTVTAGQTVAFDIDRPAGGTLDSFIRLFNSAGTQLTSNDDGPTPGEATSTESYLSRTFTTAGVYYLGVSGFGNQTYSATAGTGDAAGSTGGYILRLTSASGAPGPSASAASLTSSADNGAAESSPETPTSLPQVDLLNKKSKTRFV